VVANPTATLAPVSKTPTPTTVGRSRRGGTRDVAVKAAAASATVTDADRAETTAHGTLSSAPASSPTKKAPKLIAATIAKPAPSATRRPPSDAGSREMVTIPVITSATPIHWSALGTMPCAASTARGTTGPAAEIGATMPIAPTARRR